MTNKKLTPEQILSRDYSDEFDKLRKNRVIVSGYKYGDSRINFGQGLTDAVQNLRLCLAKYEATHNTEYMVDIANYAMYAYRYPKDGDFFRATDSSESAGHVGTTEVELREWEQGGGQ